MSSVLVKCVQTSESWQKKKVQKTGQCVNLFLKAAKILCKNDAYKGKIGQEGAKLIKALQEACETDKAMSNLKGKIKEIKVVMA